MRRTLVKLASPLVAATLLLGACGGSGSDDDPAPEPQASESSAPEENASLEDRVLATIDVEGEPDYMTEAEGAVWVTQDESSAVGRIDPESDELTSIEMGSHPCNGIAGGFGAVWVPSCGDGKLYRISTETNKVEAKIQVAIYNGTKGTPPSGGIAAAHGAVWLVTKGDKDEFDALAEIDPNTNKVARKIDLGYFGGTVTVDETSIWVTAPEDGKLLRIDPASGDITEIDGLAQPTWTAVGEGAVWVLSGTWQDHPDGDGSVTKIDAETNEIVTSIPIDETPTSAGGIRAAEGFVWARTARTMLAKIDPASDSVVESYANTGGGGDLVVAFGSLWMSDYAFNRVWRLPL